jgi:hypothetical protein
MTEDQLEQEALQWLTDFDAPCVHTLYVDKPIIVNALIHEQHPHIEKLTATLTDRLALWGQNRQLYRVFNK